jgi:parvulin-like peptidyl-prolyl isomerase
MLAAMAATVASSAFAQLRNPPAPVRNGDWIAAVVNQELVTAGEVERRLERAQAEAARAGARAPDEAELRKQVFDSLIDERVIVTAARDSGMKVDEPDIDRAVQTIAAQNQLTLEVLRQRLAAEGLDFVRFRANLRDQIMMERMREREVYQRIRINEDDVDKALAERRLQQQAEAPVNVAQILVTMRTSTLVFRIRGTPPSEEFRYVTSSPELIARAREQLRLPEAQRFLFASGGIAAGHGGHNQPWRWHFTDLALVEVAIELCDGRPTLVEADLDYWLSTVRRFCPWGSYVYAVLP